MNLKSKTTYLITAQAILFFSFLIITFFFNRFAVDDYFFIGELRTKSFIEIYQQLYFEWHGRWTSNFLLISFIQLYKVPFFLFFYNVFSVGILFLSINRLLSIVSSFYKIQLENSLIRVYSILAISVLFFCTISPSDSWVWYTSSIVYLWSTTAFIFSIALFFKEQKSITDYILFIIGLIYIGGANEPLTAFVIGLLVFLILKKKEKAISVIGLLVIGTSFLINYLSPGTINRDGITPSLGILDLISYTGYGTIKFLFFSIYKTFIPALLFAFPFYLLGKNSQAVALNFNPKKELLKSILIIGVIVFMNQLIVTYALGGLAPDRSTITSSVIIAIIIIRYLFLLGNKGNLRIGFIHVVLTFNLIFLLGFILYFSVIHYNYAKAVDQRIKSIFITNENPTQLKKLPNSGYIYSAEITADPNHYKNKHLKNGLGIKNDILLKP